MTMHDEFEKIDWLKARFELDGVPSGAVVGIGDDAAVFDTGGPSVLTVDAQVEGVHFRRDLLSPADLGWRALVSAASDIVAMAATPVATLCSLTLPRDYSPDDFEALIEGLADAATATGAGVVGGNLSQADALTLTTTVVGVPVDSPLGRKGARPGETVYVTGTLGGAALGFRILDSGAEHVPRAADFITRWRRPHHRGELSPTLAGVASACIDVSDGCLQDLGHLCRASGVGAVLDVTTLPFDHGFEDACHSLDVDPVELALGGGEDYELLFTAPRSTEADSIATAIGSVVEGDGVRALGPEGDLLSLDGGFRHFS